MSESVVIAAGGVSLRKAVGALWLARRGGSRGAEASSVAYQDGIGAMLFVVLLSGAVELVLADLLLSVLWMRVLALTLGVLAVFGMLSFIVALRVYPHRAVNGKLTIHYGACFDLSVPLELVAVVTRRKGMFDQKRTAAVNDGVLSVPVMGVTNMVITLVSPIQVHLKKTGVAVVREIQVFAVDPSSGVQALGDGERPGNADQPTSGTQQRPLWARALRWAGPLVLLAEIALVTTGLLDWRIAAGIVVATEGTLAVLGIIAGAVLVSQYRRCRAEGRSRTASFSHALIFLMPTPMVAMVRMELSVFRVLGLALVRRTEGGRPGDVTLTYGAASRKVLLGAALLFLAAGTSVLIGLATSVLWIVLGFVFLYVAVLTAAAGLASKVRPHVLQGDSLLVRWGMHQELAVPLGSVHSIEVERPQRGGRRADAACDKFSVPVFGRELVLFGLDGPVAVPRGFGRQRFAETILLPVDEAGHAAGAIAARVGLGVEGLATDGAAPRDVVATRLGKS